MKNKWAADAPTTTFPHTGGGRLFTPAILDVSLTSLFHMGCIRLPSNADRSLAPKSLMALRYGAVTLSNSRSSSSTLGMGLTRAPIQELSANRGNVSAPSAVGVSGVSKLSCRLCCRPWTGENKSAVLSSLLLLPSGWTTLCIIFNAER